MGTSQPRFGFGFGRGLTDAPRVQPRDQLEHRWRRPGGVCPRGMNRGAVLPIWWEGAGSGPVAGRQTALALVSEGEGYGSTFEIGLQVA